MPDLCMCTGNCPVKEFCYRYMATPNHFGQTFSCLESICIPNGYSELIPYNKNIQINDDNILIDYTLDDFLLAEIHNVMN